MLRQEAIFFILVLVTGCLTFFSYFPLREKERLFYQAEQFYSKKDFSKAIPFYEKSLQFGFNNPLAYYHLGDCYTQKGSFSLAESLYKSYLNLHPKSQEVRLRLARVLSWQNKLQEAEQHYRKIHEGQ